jgi:hypothetical protein
MEEMSRSVVMVGALKGCFVDHWIMAKGEARTRAPLKLKVMRILGIESSCDETGVALVETKGSAMPRLLSHALFSQIEMHQAYGGVVPELASRDHIRRVLPLTRQVLVEAGADVVIGPLDKSDVQKLNALAQLPVPVLALNYLPAGERARSGLHQFGLAPEDEGTAIADQVARDGRASILLLTTKADWATRAAAAFTERWQAHGGQVAQTATLDDMQAVDRDLRAALLVP